MIEKMMLDGKIVFFNTEELFTYASGIKSPIYCDNRLSLSNVELRMFIKNELAKKVNMECDIIIGTATAGIPHAALIADELQKPMGYVRSSAKKHGRGNMIEGISNIKGKKVVIVEDLVTTGKSVFEVVDVLKEAGAIVIQVVAIFTYDFTKTKERFLDANLEVSYLTNINKVLEVAKNEEYLNDKELEVVYDFLSGK